MGILIHCSWNVIGAASMEKSMGIFQIIKNETTIWFSNFVSGGLFIEKEDTNLKRYMHSHVHWYIIYNSQDVQTTLVSINGCVDKVHVRHTHTVEQYSAMKKKEIYHSWQHCPWGHYAKWNKSDRERLILYDFTYMWNLKQK